MIPAPIVAFCAVLVAAPVCWIQYRHLHRWDAAERRLRSLRSLSNGRKRR